VRAPALGRWLHCYTLLLALSTWAEVITGALVTSRLTSASAELEKTHLGGSSGGGHPGDRPGGLVWLSRAERWVRRLGWIVLAGGDRRSCFGKPESDDPPRFTGASFLHSQWRSRWSVRRVGPAEEQRSKIPHGLRYEASRPLRPFWRYSKCPEEQQSVTGLWELRPISWRAGGDHRHTAAGVLVTQQLPDDCTLAPAAKALMGITFVQVMLGRGAFITRMMAEEASPAVVIPSVAHCSRGFPHLRGDSVSRARDRGHLAPRGERD
jgi:hypothetical protein